MKIFFITFRSVTPAQRGESLLHKAGFRCSLQRTPRWMEEKGCGYCLRVQTDRISELIGMLHKNGVGYRKIYLVGPDGEAEEIRI